MVFSNSTGKPDTDLNAGPRGMRLRFNPDDKNTDIVAHSTPFFPTRTGKDLQAQAPTPYSYACLTYFSVTTIYLVDANGEKTAIRCRIVPDPPTESPSAEQPKDKTPQDDIKKRVREGPIGFKLLAQVAKPGFVVDDNTKHWPKTGSCGAWHLVD
jgi:catalase